VITFLFYMDNVCSKGKRGVNYSIGNCRHGMEGKHWLDGSIGWAGKGIGYYIGTWKCCIIFFVLVRSIVDLGRKIPMAFPDGMASIEKIFSDRNKNKKRR